MVVRNDHSFWIIRLKFTPIYFYINLHSFQFKTTHSWLIPLRPLVILHASCLCKGGITLTALIVNHISGFLRVGNVQIWRKNKFLFLYKNNLQCSLRAIELNKGETPRLTLSRSRRHRGDNFWFPGPYPGGVNRILDHSNDQFCLFFCI